jgi:DNA polymerase-3 subunit gamma/tau
MSISRTYRPQTFSDVSGQQHITETLRREVETGVLGHAYLFSGPRGIGKTTTARILAKALLCEHPKKGEPDNTCNACKEISDGKCIDLIEMDAASHTGVENVREAIIEHVRFGPVRWKRKVYVIDEAHMLTGSAWNALLKTLEEPPDYAVFILATTELHKVPSTIASRCQRFEFKRIAQEDMAKRIKLLAKEEGMQVDEDVVTAIVRKSDGYVREAESLLDQLGSLGEKKIAREVAELILPVSRLPQSSSLLATCADRDVSGALQSVRSLVEDGVSVMGLFDDLLEVIRLLIRSEDPKERALLENGDEGERSIITLIGRFTRAELGEIALLIIERRRDAKGGVDPVFALELLVLAIAGGLLPSQGGQTGRPDGERTSGRGQSTKPENRSSASTEKKIANDPTPATESSKNELAESKPAQATGPIEISEVRSHWTGIVRAVEQQNRSLPFILKICNAESVNGSTVMIRFQYPFHLEKIINDIKTKRLVETAMREVLNRDDIIIDGVVGDLIGTAERPLTTDIVTKVLTAFGGQLVE